MIEISNVSFQYKDCERENALKNINLTIHSGEVVLLCGESGCGKSTITRLINGLIPGFYEGDLTGSVKINNQEVNAPPICDTAKQVGSIFQNPRTQFFNVDTYGELIFGCENLGWDKEKIEKKQKEIISKFGIEKLMGRSIFSLSGGEKQQLACAAVSIMEPDIMVLDEPSSSLDFQAIDELKKIIADWKQQGKTVVIAEHRIYYLRDLLDRIIYMKNGQIEKDLVPNEFMKLGNELHTKMGLRSWNLNTVFPQREHTTLEKTAELKDFNFTYKKSTNKTLDIKELKIPAKGIIAIIGHNGAGKSTFARCLCGLEKRCKGTLNIGNKQLNTKKRLKAGYMVMQEVGHQLFTESVSEELLISMENQDKQKADEILSQLDLLCFKEAHPLALSGGQQQRVAIASAVASNRTFIVFDEPTSGLDLRHMNEVAEILDMLNKKGKMVFVITHDYELICKCCTHIIRLEHGTVKENYPLDIQGLQTIRSFYKI